MKEGDLVLCTVEKVTPTVTQVRLLSGQEGTIVSSEIAPGRIKFLRQYVVPNKKVVCKILEISGSHIHLSLRRVSSKEKKEVMQFFKQEQTANTAFNQLLGENSEKIKQRILIDFKSLIEFVDKSRNDEKLISKYIPKECVKAFQRIIAKKRKRSEIKQLIKIKCLEEDGINKIKSIFDFKNENISIAYLSAGEFKLKLMVDDFKQGKKQMQDILEKIEEKAKKFHCEFSSKEEK